MKNTIALGAALAASLLAFGTAAQAQTYSHRDHVRSYAQTVRVAHVDRFGPNGDIDRDGIRNRNDRDRDGDGIENRSDPNPNVWNPTRIVRRGHDMDHDGIADRDDRDRDGDRVANGRDRFPNDPRRS